MDLVKIGMDSADLAKRIEDFGIDFEPTDDFLDAPREHLPRAEHHLAGVYPGSEVTTGFGRRFSPPREPSMRMIQSHQTGSHP